MDYLWTPWRYAYVTAAEKAPGCIFCDLPKAGDDAKVRIVCRREHCYVVLNTYPYTPGHVMIVPYAHLDELQKLTPTAAHEMMDLARRLETVLRKLVTMTPDSPEAWYDLAATQAALGRTNEALQNLAKAMELNRLRLATNQGQPDLRKAVTTNAGFDALRASPEFQKLIGPP